MAGIASVQAQNIEATGGAATALFVSNTTVLGAAVALTATNVYQEVLSVPLPAAGPYLIIAQVKATLLATDAAPYATARLFDVTAGAVVAGSELFVAFSPAAGAYGINTATLCRVFHFGGPTTLRLEAARRQATVWTQAEISSDVDGRTCLTFIRLPT